MTNAELQEILARLPGQLPVMIEGLDGIMGDAGAVERCLGWDEEPALVIRLECAVAADETRRQMFEGDDMVAGKAGDVLTYDQIRDGWEWKAPDERQSQ